MLLTTAAYFSFLAAVFFAYWLAARYRLGALAVVLFANYFFYARWDLAYLAIIPAASTCDFFIGRALHRSARPGLRRLLVTLSIVLNVGLIASVKYLPVLPWVLPLALSFYGFQSLTYTIDIYRRDAKPADSYLAYLASASFFPTTVAGPITRLSTLWPQWSKREMLSAQDGGKALFLIGLGLVKKLLIADFLAETLVNRVFDLPKLYSGAEVLAGVYGYALQLYYDFSGYTDIAHRLGAAARHHAPAATSIAPTPPKTFPTFGVAGTFRSPIGCAIISISRCPACARAGRCFAYLNLVITMVIGGLWHGAGWTFLVWGAWHGIGLAAHRGWQALHGNPKLTLSRAALRFLCGLATFHFVLDRLDLLPRFQPVHRSRYPLPNLFWHHLFCEHNSGVRACAARSPPPRTMFRSAGTTEGSSSTANSLITPRPRPSPLLVVAIRYVAGSGSAPFIYSRF